MIMHSVVAGSLLAVFAIAQPLSTPKRLTDAEMEDFLLTAKMGDHRAVSTGITGTERATLTKDGFTHYAHIQTVDISKPSFQTDRGTELNFRDCYKFNVAGYRLDRLLGIHMMPVSVERNAYGKNAAVTWWVDDLLMMELDRHKKGLQAPDQDAWNMQMYTARVFDELVYDTDPNLGNFLIDTSWRLWIVDKSRAFRIMPGLREPKNLVRCDRSLLAALRKLDEQTLAQTIKGLLTKTEQKAILSRRDKIVKFFDDQVAKSGEAAVLFDLRRP